MFCFPETTCCGIILNGPECFTGVTWNHLTIWHLVAFNPKSLLTEDNAVFKCARGGETTLFFVLDESGCHGDGRAPIHPLAETKSPLERCCLLFSGVVCVGFCHSLCVFEGGGLWHRTSPARITTDPQKHTRIQHTPAVWPWVLPRDPKWSSSKPTTSSSSRPSRVSLARSLLSTAKKTKQFNSL